MPVPEPSMPPKRRPWIEFSLLFLLLAGLSWMAWQKWETVWIERSADFFPQQLIGEEPVETLVWKYPIYRSNDTYQWVYMADAIATGHPEALRHRSNEGPIGGRQSTWSSLLPRLMSIGGSSLAWWTDSPVEQNIHQLTHWLGAVLQLGILCFGSLCIYRLKGKGAAFLFALLFYFIPAIAWDFGFSRLDHEVLFQFALIAQLLGLYGLIEGSSSSRNWALLAGIGAGLGWWLGATVHAAIGCLTTFACFFRYANIEAEQRNSWLIYGASSLLVMGLAFIVDHRPPFGTSMNALHPIYLPAQIGVVLGCGYAATPKALFRSPMALVGTLLGLCPLIWLILYGSEAHLWLDPLQNRFHHVIVEMQSPFANGLWQQPENLSLWALTTIALICNRWTRPSTRVIGILTVGLSLLALYQTRWGGMAGSSSLLLICFNMDPHSKGSQQNWQWTANRFAASGLGLLFAVLWIGHWARIEEKTPRQLIVDFYVQVSGRDINLNLQAYSEGQDSRAILPMPYAANTALFPNIYPLGTFYWENRDGLAEACEFYTTSDPAMAAKIVEEQQIDYLAVSRLQLGIPFLNLANEIAHGEGAPDIRQSFGWKLGFGESLPDWCEEVPYYGSINPQIYSARIYRVRHERLK